MPGMRGIIVWTASALVVMASALVLLEYTNKLHEVMPAAHKPHTTVQRASPAPKSRELTTWQHRDAYHWTYTRHKNKDATG